MSYLIFYTGLSSTPNSVGLKNISNNEVIHEICCSRPTGKETREKYRVVEITETRIFTVYADNPKSVRAEWDKEKFLTEGFGINRVHVPDFVFNF